MERYLDVRDRQPPEPLELILAELDELPAQDWLRVRHRRDPVPLYNILREMGFKWHSCWVADEIEIVIWHEANRNFDREKVAPC